MVDHKDSELAEAMAQARQRGIEAKPRVDAFMRLPIDDVACLPQLLERLGGSEWNVRRLLYEPQRLLNGLTGMQALGRGWTKKVIDAAESIDRGDFD